VRRHCVAPGAGAPRCRGSDAVVALPFPWLDGLVDAGWLGRLTGAEVRVLLALGRSMTQRNSAAFPGPGVLVVRTGLSRSAVYEALVGLRERGLIEPRTAERQGRFRAYRVTEYRLVTPIPPASTVRPGGPYPETQEAPVAISPDGVSSTPADTTVRPGGHVVLSGGPPGEDLKASAGGPPGSRPLTRTVRASTTSPAETLARIRRHVGEVLSSKDTLPAAAIRDLVAFGERSGVGASVVHGAIDEAVAASSPPLVGQAIAVFGPGVRVVEVAPVREDPG
jgi:DNA-binding transcriptional ArsR family regulator